MVRGSLQLTSSQSTFQQSKNHRLSVPLPLEKMQNLCSPLADNINPSKLHICNPLDISCGTPKTASKLLQLDSSDLFTLKGWNERTGKQVIISAWSAKANQKIIGVLHWLMERTFLSSLFLHREHLENRKQDNTALNKKFSFLLQHVATLANPHWFALRQQSHMRKCCTVSSLLYHNHCQYMPTYEDLI